MTCTQGHYCPSGTGNSPPAPTACPAGTFSDAFNATQVESCRTCPARFTCQIGTGGPTGPGACTPGYYCPEGTSNTALAVVGADCARPEQCPCPPGTFSPADNLMSADECTLCPPGRFCPGGLTITSGPCAAGYFCPNGTASATQMPCPAGTFATATDLFDVEQCAECPVGHFCDLADTLPEPCPAGTYANETGTAGVGACRACPDGSFCPSTGTVQPSSCGRGKHSAASASVCATCPVGRFCPFNETTTALMQSSLLACPAGLFCPAGTDHEPEFTNDACVAGSYCLRATAAPAPCPAGTYSPHPGGESGAVCLPCPAGSYCGTQALTAVSGTCAPGYYCPESSVTATAVACPSKFYRGHGGGRRLSDCALCPSGKTCGTATVVPSPCPVGSYCVVGVDVAEACPRGTFGNSTGVRRAEDCTPCTPGSFCQVQGLTEPTGLCSPGYFCLEGSDTSAPVNPLAPMVATITPIGGICPPGGYCPAGSSKPEACPAGTFSNVTGASNVSVCLGCVPGSFCQGSSNPFPSGLCSPGYFCTGGASSATQFETPAGFFTGAGAPAPVACVPGTFNNELRQSSCKPCTAGRFCNASATIVPRPCPPGRYCPLGTADPPRCPSGRFSPSLFLENATACSLCPPGSFCESTGLTAPEGVCSAGFYCTGGATVRNPGAALLTSANITFENRPVNGTGPNATNATRVVVVVNSGPEYNSSVSAECGAGLASGGPCPAGHYCLNGTSAPTLNPCPAGTYNPFPARTSLEGCLPCPAGSFCGTVGLVTPSGPCAPGHFCSGGAASARPMDGVTGNACPRGTFCAGGNSIPASCPAGTFGNDTALSQCLVCPGRHFCDGSSPAQFAPCPAGRFCPAGTGASQPSCPKGTFNPIQLLRSEDECAPCTAGSFCGTPGLAAPTGLCAAGFYCPRGSADMYGRLRNTTSGDVCDPRDDGRGLVAPGNVSAAAWALAVSGGSPITDFFEGRAGPRRCPPGFYCPAGSALPVPCLEGTFLAVEGAASRAECSLCTGGSHCNRSGLPAPSGQCAEGHFCQRGNTDSRPATGVFNVSVVATGASLNATVLIGGGPCPAGHFCPGGTVTPLPCPNGTYNSFTGRGRDGCSVCPEGFFCTLASTRYDDKPCPPGHYCPPGTPHAARFPCPSGTFSNASMLRRLDECVPCFGGTYCPGPASTAPAGLCDAGFYCRSGASTPTPLDGVTGARCLPGEFCQAGSTLPRFCQGGKFCLTSSGVPDGDCFAGYYCRQGSSTPAPTGQTNVDGIVGDICPPGRYCPNGTITPVLCPAGTFTAASGNRRLQDCTNCTAGSYCPVAGLTAPNQTCLPGFYCPPGTSFPTLSCPPGTRCPAGSQIPEPCPAGTHQPRSGDPVCLKCPAGFYCVNGTATPLPCPAGFFCPNGTGSATQHPCPTGTFSPVTGLFASDQCASCLPGSYCDAPGLTAPRSLCSAGHYCLGRASVPAPAEGFARGYVGSLTLGCGGNCSGSSSPDALWRGYAALNLTANASQSASRLPTTGDVCPRGHFCVQGSASPAQCPAGSYNSEFGGTGEVACKPCLAGFYCPNSSAAFPTQRCPEGFFCPPGRVQPEHRCGPGTFCPVGSPEPVPCPSGTFEDRNGSGACQTCPEGRWCGPGTVTPVPCPAGYFCGPGTALPNASACSPGTFSNASGLANATQCTPCSPGQFCARHALTAPSGPCDAGFYCTVGSPTPNPGLNHSEQAVGTCAAPTLYGFPGGPGLSPLAFGGRCPAGAYCPLGSAAPVLCPAGTAANSTGNTAAGDCRPCLAGFRCPARGTVAPTLPCVAGHFCPGGQATGTELPCPVGTSCPLGSPAAVPCAAGSFANETTLAACRPCPPGFGCSMGTVFPALCLPGFVCPASSPNTSAVPCAAGTSSNRTGLSAPAQCEPCPSGQFCGARGLTRPSGPCGPGHYCSTGSWTPTPGSNLSYTVRADALHLADAAAGASDARAAALWAAAADELRVGGPCAPGHVCTYGSATATPHHPEQARLTAWPALQTRYGELSPSTLGAGTRDLVAALVSEAARLGVGFATALEADGVAITRLDAAAASNATTCPGGRANGTSLPAVVRVDPLAPPMGYQCPAGTSCGVAATAPGACAPGTFANATGSSGCDPCPAGQLCTGATSNPSPCPERYYCPASSFRPVVCPPGSVGRHTELQSAAQCAPCPPGSFCSEGAVTDECWGGFVCVGNSSVPDPVLGSPDQVAGHGYPCPAGFFCPNGTSLETPCPGGTFSSVVGASASHVCGPCPPGSVCFPGIPTASPCPRGHFCPGLSVITPCPSATYNPDQSSTSEAACRPCPAGTLCNRTAVVDPTALPCPAGAYCGVSARVPIPCPAATHRSTTGGSSEASCAPCPGGRHCGVGTISPPACPAGSYCPVGSASPVQCEPGRVCATAGLSASAPCPAGFFCRNGTATPAVCPIGTYCEGGNFEPVVCPPGTVQRATTSAAGRVAFALSCRVCPPGTFSEASDGLECKPCTPGYVCLGGTRSATPTNASTDAGFPCPPGFFCPQGSSTEKACPAGRYNPLSRKSNISDCLGCQGNSYNQLQGQSSCRPCSASAFTVSNASTTCSCRGAFRHFQATDGKCVCQPGYEFVDDELIVRSEEDGEQDCQPKTFAVCEQGESRLASGQCAAVDCSSTTQCPSGRGRFVPSMGLCACDGLPEAEQVCGADCQAAITRVQVHPTTGRLVVTDPATGQVLREVNPSADIPGFVGSLGCVSPDSPGSTGATDPGAADAGSVSDAAVNATACRVHTMVVAPGTGFSGVYAAPAAVVSATAGAGTARRLREQAASMSGRRLGRLVATATGVDEVAAHEDGWTVAAASTGLAPVTPSSARGARFGPRGLASADGTTRGRRLRNTVAQQTAAERRARELATAGPAVARPTVCLSRGDAVMFELPNGADSIPVYVKDSFLNTNQGFDYGEFRRLGALAAQDSSSVAVFAFSFREAGRYVFQSSSDAAQQTIIVVQEFGQSCPTGGAFSPPSEASLVALGVKETTDPMLAPDWRAIAAVLGGLLAVVALVLTAAAAFRHRAFGQRGTNDLAPVKIGIAAGGKAASKTAAGTGTDADADDGGLTGGAGAGSHGESRFAKRIGDAGDDDEQGRSKSRRGNKGRPGKSGGSGDSSDSDWDSDFDDEFGGGQVRVLLDALRKGQRDADASFARQSETLQEMLARLRAEAEGLRRLLADAALSQGATAAGAREAEEAARRSAVLRQLEAEVGARLLQGRLLSRLEEDVVETLAGVGRALREAPGAVASDIVDELFTSARDRAEDASTTATAPFSRRADADADVKGGPGDEPAEAATTVAALVDAAKALQLEDSPSGDDVSVAVAACREAIGAFAEAVREEFERRATGVPLWQRAAGAGVLSGEGAPPSTAAVRRALEEAEDSRGPHDAAVRTALEPLAAFAEGSWAAVGRVRDEVRTLRASLAAAVEQQNPAVAERVRAAAAGGIGLVLSDLHAAVEALLGRVPPLIEAARDARESSDMVNDGVLPLLQRARAEADDVVRQHRLTRGGLPALLDRVNTLIEDARRGKYYYGGAYMEGGDGDGSDAGGSDAGSQADVGGALARAADAEAEVEADGVRKRLADGRAARKAEEEAEARRAREAEERRLREAEMDEERRRKLLDGYDEDRRALDDAMEAERGRQEAEMAGRLEDRKQERMRRRLRRAEERAQAELEERRKAGETETKERQREEKEDLDASLRREEEDARRQARGAGGAGSSGVQSTELRAQEARADLRRAVEEARAARADARREALERLDAATAAARADALAPLPGRFAGHLASLREPPAPGAIGYRREALESQLSQWRSAGADCAKAEDEAGDAAALSLAAARTTRRESTAAAARRALDVSLDLADSADRELRSELERAERERAQNVARLQQAAREKGDDAAMGRAAAEAEEAADRARMAAEAAAQAARGVTAALRAEAELATRAAAADADEADARDAAAVASALAEAGGERAAAVARGMKRAERLLSQLQLLQDAADVGGDEAVRRLWRRQQEEEDEEAERRAEAAAAGEEEDEGTPEWEAAMEARERAQAAALAAERAAEREVAGIRGRHAADVDALRGREDAERARQHGEAAKARRERRERWAADRKRRLNEAARAAPPGAARDAAEAAARDADVAAASRAADEDAAADGDPGTGGPSDEAAARGAFDAESELRKLRQRADDESAAAESAALGERRRQEAELAERLASRRARRERGLERRKQEVAAAAAAEARAAGRSEEEAEEAARTMLGRMEQEAERLRAHGEEEDAADAEALEAQLRDEEEEAASGRRVAEASVEDEAARLRSDFDARAEAAAAAALGEKRRQAAALESRLRSRRERRERELRRRQQQEAAEEKARLERDLGGAAAEEAVARALAEEGADAEAALSAGDEGGAATAGAGWERQVLQAVAAAASGAPGTAADAALAAQERADAEEAERLRREVEEEAAREHEELAQRQEEERRAAAEAAAAQEAAEAEEREGREEAERQRKLDRKRAEVEARIAAANETSGEEAERLREQFEAELTAYEESMGDERRRQRDVQERRLEARRQRQARMLRRKQERELEEAADRAAAKKRELEAEEERRRERRALQAVLAVHGAGDDADDAASLAASLAAAGGAGRSGETVEVVLRNRHSRETSEMLERQYAERARRLRDALETVFEDKHAAKTELMSRLEERGAAAGEEEEELRALEQTYGARRAEEEERIGDELEGKHAQEQLDLRSRQLEQLRAMLTELAPDDEARRQEAEEAATKAAEMRDLRERVERERGERLAAAREAQDDLEERLRRETEEEMARLNEEHERQLGEERERQERALRARQERMTREREEAQRRARDETSSLDEEARERILAELVQNQERLAERLDQQRRQQQQDVQARLESRARRRRRKVELRLAEQRALKQLEQQRAATAARAEEARRLKELEDRQKREAAAAASTKATSAGGASRASSSFAVALGRASRRAMSGVNGDAPRGGGRARGGLGLGAIGEGGEDEDDEEGDEEDDEEGHEGAEGVDALNDDLTALGVVRAADSADVGGRSVAGSRAGSRRRGAGARSVAGSARSRARRGGPPGGVDVPALSRRLARLETTMQQALAAAAAVGAAPGPAAGQLAIADGPLGPAIDPADRAPAVASVLRGTASAPPAGTAETVPPSEAMRRHASVAQRVLANVAAAGPAAGSRRKDPLAGAVLRFARSLPAPGPGIAGTAWDASSGTVWLDVRALADQGQLVAAIATAAAAVRFEARATADGGAAELRHAMAAAGRALAQAVASDSQAVMDRPPAAALGAAPSTPAARTPASSGRSASASAAMAVTTPNRPASTSIASNNSAAPSEPPPSFDRKPTMSSISKSFIQRARSSVTSAPGARAARPSAKSRWTRAATKVISMRREDVDVRGLLAHVPMNDETDDAGLELDLQEARRADDRSLGAGSVADQLSRVPALARQADVGAYFAALEEAVMRPTRRRDTPKSASAPTADAATGEAESKAREQSDGTTAGLLRVLEAEAEGVEAQLNTATRDFLQKQRDGRDIEARVAALRETLAAQERTMDLVKRSERSVAARAAAAERGEAYEEADKEIDGLDVSGLPERSDLEARVVESHDAIAEAERARKVVQARVRQLAELQETLETRLAQRRAEADRLRTMTPAEAEAHLQGMLARGD